MATSRLPFLYPNLLRSVRSCEPTTYRSIRYSPRYASARLHTNNTHEQDTIRQRYGPAVEPRSSIPPGPKDTSGPAPAQSSPKDVAKNEEGDAKEGDGGVAQSKDPSGPSKHQNPSPGEESSSSGSPPDMAPELESRGEAGRAPSASEDGSTPDPASSISAQNQEEDPLSGHLKSIFEMPAPGAGSSQASSGPSESESSSSESEQPKPPPHISPPPYVHHFDTYTLVKDLGQGGFTEEQTVQIMKAVRGSLAQHLKNANDGLCSKSDFENENYLFRAACSELRNSLQTSRNAEIQAQRSRRAQLQHESDILSQRLNQELTGLNDNLKEMYNEQKIWTRELQRSLDTAIQELNYQITVSLHSDGKSEVEGLRWILTRRAVLAIATSAVMIILALRYHAYKHHERELKVKAAETAAASQTAQDNALNGSINEGSEPPPTSHSSQ